MATITNEKPKRRKAEMDADKIFKSLEGKILFSEKLKRANEILKIAGLPKEIRN